MSQFLELGGGIVYGYHWEHMFFDDVKVWYRLVKIWWRIAGFQRARGANFGFLVS
jgi:hypothetical protein